MLIKPFVWWQSRWRRRCGLLKLPFKEMYEGNSHYYGVTELRSYGVTDTSRGIFVTLLSLQRTI